MLIIPFEAIAADTLHALLEELVTRDGTDYGERELSVGQKVAEVLGSLRSGEACLCYDEVTESCSVLPVAEAKRWDK